MSWPTITVILGIIWAIVVVIFLLAWYARGIGVSDND